tara:strand:+ start:179 stop:409 length:231 start_codon:yes stop_codon:yes gene_type:complete
MAWTYENEQEWMNIQKYDMDVNITCKLCQEVLTHKSKHNGMPLVVGPVCSDCNAVHVIPHRLLKLERQTLNKEKNE